MTQGAVLEVARQGLIVGLLITMPVLAIALFTGLIVSIFQAVTQIQEMTLTYLPKLIGAGIILVAMGGWMLSTLVTFMRNCFEIASRMGMS